MILRDVHQSGHAPADGGQDVAALGGLAAAATVGLVTEARTVKMLEGWDSAGQETKVVWNTAKWSRIAHGIEDIPTPPWKRGTAHRTTFEVSWALLRNVKSGLLLLRGGGHLPVHLFLPAQLAANNAALNGLAEVVNRLIEENAPAVTTFSFDFNRNLRRRTHRRIVNKAIAGTGLHLVIPPQNTLGHRTIDAHLTTGDLAQVAMLPRVRGYDHRGIVLAVCACPSTKENRCPTTS